MIIEAVAGGAVIAKISLVMDSHARDNSVMRVNGLNETNETIETVETIEVNDAGSRPFRIY